MCNYTNIIHIMIYTFGSVNPSTQLRKSSLVVDKKNSQFELTKRSKTKQMRQNKTKTLTNRMTNFKSNINITSHTKHLTGLFAFLTHVSSKSLTLFTPTNNRPPERTEPYH